MKSAVVSSACIQREEHEVETRAHRDKDRETDETWTVCRDRRVEQGKESGR